MGYGCWIFVDRNMASSNYSKVSFPCDRGCGYIWMGTILPSAHPLASASRTRLMTCGRTWIALKIARSSSWGFMEQTTPTMIISTHTFHLHATRGHPPHNIRSLLLHSFPVVHYIEHKVTTTACKVLLIGPLCVLVVIFALSACLFLLCLGFCLHPRSPFWLCTLIYMSIVLGLYFGLWFICNKHPAHGS